MTTDPATEALAEAWASMDGKHEAFARERALDVRPTDQSYTGHYIGYLAEAEEMVRRLKARGFVIVADANPAGGES